MKAPILPVAILAALTLGAVWSPSPASAAVIATFSGGTLNVFGDALDNTIVLSRSADGTILVNGGAVKIAGGTATVANTALIKVFGQAGNDTISLDEKNGPLPSAHLFGGAGNDHLVGGSQSDQLFGQDGNDTLQGGRGNDFLFGGDDNDIVLAGDGADQAFGQAGDDKVTGGEGHDLLDGGAGVDLLDGGPGTDSASSGENVKNVP
jgi:Ca2+-binding RTX toxin-like protein